MRPPCFSSNRPAGTTGFSLVEVAFAIAVLAVSFLALLSLVPPAHQQLKTAMDTTTAVQIARSVVSELQAAGLGEVLRLGQMEGANAPHMANLPVQYFTSTGREVAPDDLDCAYHVNTRILCDELLAGGGGGSLKRARGWAVLTVEVVAAPAGVPVVIGKNGLVDRTKSPFPLAAFPSVIGGHSAR